MKPRIWAHCTFASARRRKLLASCVTLDAAHPDHFHLAANLGTAWELTGDLKSALETLDDAVKLAPAKQKAAEAAQRKLVELRLHEKNKNDLDALFDGKPTDSLRLAAAIGDLDAGRRSPALAIGRGGEAKRRCAHGREHPQRLRHRFRHEVIGAARAPPEIPCRRRRARREKSSH